MTITCKKEEEVLIIHERNDAGDAQALAKIRYNEIENRLGVSVTKEMMRYHPGGYQ